MSDQQRQSQEYPSALNTGYPPSQQLPPPPRYQFHFSEKQMRRYFNPLPRRLIQCLIAGVVLLFISPIFLIFIFLPILAGITLLLIGIIWLIINYTTGPSEEQYRGWLTERQNFLVNQAHQKAFLDLTQLESPLFVFKGSVRPNSREAKNYKEAYQKDTSSGPLFSINTHLIIFLTKDNIIAYSSEIDALDQKWSTSTVRYYYYEHVSGIQIADTVLENTTNPNFHGHIRAQIFYLLIDSGERIGSDLVISMGLEDANGMLTPDGSNDQLINRLISLLKDHKVSKLEARGSSFDNAAY